MLEKINDNAYKIYLQGKCHVSTTFNVTNLSRFYADSDLRTNPFQEGDNDISLIDEINNKKEGPNVKNNLSK